MCEWDGLHVLIDNFAVELNGPVDLLLPSTYRSASCVCRWSAIDMQGGSLQYASGSVFLRCGGFGRRPFRFWILPSVLGAQFLAFGLARAPSSEKQQKGSCYGQCDYPRE